MNLWRITFTGADDNTNFQEMQNISKKYNCVEWGILFSQSKSGVARYPSHDNIEEICGLGLQLSAHLCGAWVSDAMNGELTFLKNPLADKFGRIQLNCYKDRLRKALKSEKLLQAISGVEQDIILGGNFAKEELDYNEHEQLRGIHLLFDASGGHGKTPRTWRRPYNGWSCGMAGGLNPENLEEQLGRMGEVVGNRHIWIDFETGIRTDDELDLEKVQKCLEIAEPWMLPGCH